MSLRLPKEMNGRPLHDLGDARYWGNDYSVLKVIDEGQQLRLCVFRSARMKPGDYLAIPNDDNDPDKRSRYEIETIDTPMDPGDQHFITARWAPVTAEEQEQIG
jgi:hypothetical protein